MFLDEAYALVDSGRGMDAGGDSFSREAIRTLLTETENNRTGLMVVLAGYKDKMAHLMSADPGLDRRFPLRLDLPDYSPAEIASICRKVAAENYDKSFAAGLEPALAAHVAHEYYHEISQSNGGLAVNLTEAAVDNLSERVISLLDEPQDEESEPDPERMKQRLLAAAKVLEAEDFGIPIRTAEESRRRDGQQWAIVVAKRRD